MKHNILFTSILFLFFEITGSAQSGASDITFNSSGRVVSPCNLENGDRIWALAVCPDGKIIAAGNCYNGTDFDFAFARYNANGTLDNSFSGDGILTYSLGATNDKINSIAIQSDGKIVASGYSEIGSTSTYVLIRLNRDGTLDKTFGDEGIVSTPIEQFYFFIKAIALQPDGKIVAAGGSWNGTNWDVAIARFLSNGKLDNTFNGNGIYTRDVIIGKSDNANAVAISNGKIIAVGKSGDEANSCISIVRVTSDGLPDGELIPNDASTVTFPQGKSIGVSTAIQRDGKIVVAGQVFNGTNWNFGVSRVNYDGSYDNSFGTYGNVITPIGLTNDYAYCSVIQPDGKIIIGGYTETESEYDFALVRLSENGKLDNTFGVNGIVQPSTGFAGDACYAMALQRDGNLIAAGESQLNGIYHFVVARFLTGQNLGVVDFEVDNSPFIYPNPIKDKCKLEYALKNDEQISIYLVDLKGEIAKSFILKEKQSKGAKFMTLTFDESIKSGNYILIIDNGFAKQQIKCTLLHSY